MDYTPGEWSRCWAVQNPSGAGLFIGFFTPGAWLLRFAISHELSQLNRFLCVHSVSACWRRLIRLKRHHHVADCILLVVPGLLPFSLV